MLNLENFKRTFSRWSTLRSEAGGGKLGVPSTSAAGPAVTGGSHHDNDPANIKVRPSRFDRTALVWSGQYKNAGEIPEKVHQVSLHRARTWARIRINIYLVLFTAMGSGVMVYLGKRASARGENITDMNLEWHRKINEEHRKEQAVANSAK